MKDRLVAHAGIADDFLRASGAENDRFRVLPSGGGTAAFVRDLPAEGGWFGPYGGEDAAYQRFARSISSRADTDPIALLKRQRAVYERAGLREGLPLYDAIIAGALGRLRPISRLEAALLLIHQQRFGDASEFVAYVLRGPRGLRVYYVGGPVAAGPSEPGVEEMVRKDAGSGWVFGAHLHNHPFSLDNPYGDIAGTTIPSEPDANTYFQMRAWGLQNAVITNGFHAIEFRAEEFGRLRTGSRSRP